VRDPSSRLLIRGARQLVTAAAGPGPRRRSALQELRVIEDCAVLIENGVICEVGPSRRVERLLAARAAESIDASGRVVMPAFIDPLTQLLCGPLRVSCFEEASRIVRGYSAQRMQLEAVQRLRRFLRYGVITLGAGCGYGLDPPSELKALRVLGHLRRTPMRIRPQFHAAAHVPPEFGARSADFLGLLERTALPRIRQRSLAFDVLVSDAFETTAAAAYLEAASRLGFSPVRRFALHACMRDVAVLLPGIPYHAAGSYPAVRDWIDSGTAVALGTGFDHLLSPTMSMPFILSLACTQMRMTPEEALNAATINAAHALGVDRETGSIEAGKQADLLILSCSDYREIPWMTGMNPVIRVLRAGSTVFPREKMSG
jgi:imidazolonepropionase